MTDNPRVTIRTDDDGQPLSYVVGEPLADGPDFGELTLPAFLRDVTSRYAGREALVHRTADGVARWSYAELWEQSVRVARALIASGMGKDSRVGILMTNRPEWIAGAFGIALAGGVVVALNTFSTPDELEYQLKVSNVSVLLFEREVARTDFLAVLRKLEPAIGGTAREEICSRRFPYLRRVVVVGDDAGGAVEEWDEFLGQGAAVPVELIEAAAAGVTPSDVGGLFFTSGSTGRAKGVVSRHQAMALACRRFCWAMDLKGDVRAWSPNGFFWSGNFAILMGSTLSCGGAIVLQSKFDVAEALRLIEAERVTICHCWPHQWSQLEASPGWPAADLSSLTYVTPAQPAARHPTVTAASTLPARSFGCSETFTLNTAYRANTDPAIAGTSHGVPLPGNAFKIVDPDSGEVLPLGESGEIALKGLTLMVGYIGVSPEETFDAEGFYRTGDKGRFDEHGRLFFEGRIKEMIKSGGANVAPAEIDLVLARHPAVRIARSVGVPHPTLGEMIVSCIVPVDGATPDEAEVRDWLKERIAAYKLPRRVLHFREDELPLTGASLKIKSNELRDMAIARLEAEAEVA